MLGKMAEVELSLVWGFRYTPTLERHVGNSEIV
jgi:hypothetical protein